MGIRRYIQAKFQPLRRCQAMRFDGHIAFAHRNTQHLTETNIEALHMHEKKKYAKILCQIKLYGI